MSPVKQSWRKKFWSDPNTKPDRMVQARAIAAGTLTADDYNTEAIVAFLLSLIGERDEAIESLKHSRAEALKDPAEQAKMVERMLDDIRRADEPDVMAEVLDSIYPPEPS